jgi:hypothetical protein
MSYRDKTPQILSILTRKLKPGKSFEDFQKAHLPPGKTEKDIFGYNSDYFTQPTRVIDAISVNDPTIIVSIGLTYGHIQNIAQEVAEKAHLEIERRNKIAEVAEKIGNTEVFVIASDSNFGGKDPQFIQTELEKDPGPILELMKKK